MAVVMLAHATARADVSADVGKAFTAFVDSVAGGKPAPGLELFIVPGHAEDDPVPLDLTKLRTALAGAKVSGLKVVPARSGKSAWLVAEISVRVAHGAKTTAGQLRASALVAQDETGWHVRATHWSLPAANQPTNMCGDREDWRIAPGVPGPLAPQVKAILDSLEGDKSERFVKLLSDDKNAIAIGSAPKEKFVGGPAIKAIFKKWDIGGPYYERDKDPLPARASITADGELMWIAMSISSPWHLCTSYRTLFVLAKEPSGWKIVHHHYSEHHFDL